MSTSRFVLLLSCGAVLQLTAAFPQQGVYRDTQTNTSDHLSSARDTMLASTLEILANQSSNILHISNHVMTNLVLELEMTPDRTPKVNKIIKRFQKALKHIDNINFDDQQAELEKIFAAVDEVGAIFDDIELLPDGNDIKILENALEKLGRKSVAEKFGNTMEQTILQLTKTFEDFENSLSDEEKQEVPEMIDWIKRFKESDNFEEQLGPLIQEFLDFFD